MSHPIRGGSEDDRIVSNRLDRSCILTINGGSSSLKFALFDGKSAPANSPERLLTGRIERIGLPDARASVSGPDGSVWETWPVSASDLGAAAEVLIVNHESGLLGVSETSPDLRDLLVRQDQDIRAAEAVSLFFYQARKAIGALAAALGGLDILVFSGGIGENSTEARARICEGLDFIGIILDTMPQPGRRAPD